MTRSMTEGANDDISAAAIMSEDWLAETTDADTRAVQRFINGPGYACGSAHSR